MSSRARERRRADVVGCLLKQRIGKVRRRRKRENTKDPIKIQWNFNKDTAEIHKRPVNFFSALKRVSHHVSRHVHPPQDGRYIQRYSKSVSRRVLSTRPRRGREMRRGACYP